MYSDRRGTDKNHPRQNLPDKRPPDKTPGQKPREQLRENLYKGLLSGFFVLGVLKIGGVPEMCDVLLVEVPGCVTKCDRERGHNWPKRASRSLWAVPCIIYALGW